jgi:hypothetical protein
MVDPLPFMLTTLKAESTERHTRRGSVIMPVDNIGYCARLLRLIKRGAERNQINLDECT